MLTFLGLLAVVLLHYQKFPDGGLTFSIPQITSDLAREMHASGQCSCCVGQQRGFRVRLTSLAESPDPARTTNTKEN